MSFVLPASTTAHASARALLVFDLDGTLFDSDGADYDDPESLEMHVRVHRDACDRVIHAACVHGVSVAYLTGRSEPVREVTQRHIMTAGLPRGMLFMQPAWEGYERMVDYKATILRGLQPLLYVGDHEADMRAAQNAIVTFCHANDWRDLGKTIPTIHQLAQEVALLG